MRPVSVDEYLDRLERALHRRGVDDARIVDEAREHLVDAIEHARQGGLSVDDAVREAFERFGAPEVVAAHAVSDGEVMWRRIASASSIAWQRKWWIVVPTVVAALLTSISTYYFLPVRYRAESIVQIVPARVPAEFVRPATTESIAARFERSRQGVLSRTRLERVIGDFGLYKHELEHSTLSEVVQLMRTRVKVTPLSLERELDGDSRFSVSFEASEPRVAMQVADRFTAYVIEDHLRSKQAFAQGAEQFIQSQIEDVRERIVAYERKLQDLRSKNGSHLSQAELLPFQVLQDRYRALLIQSEESRTAMNLDQRQIGEQFRLLEPSRLPERPVGPSRLLVNVFGAFVGLCVGLALAAALGRSHKTSGSGGERLRIAMS